LAVKSMVRYLAHWEAAAAAEEEDEQQQQQGLLN